MRLILRSALIFTFAGATLLAHDDKDTPGWIPVLEVRTVSASPTGSSAYASGTRNLVKGEPITATMASGTSLCSLGTGETPPGQPVPNNVWKMNGEYLGEQAGRHQVRVTSGFTRLGGQPASETTTQTLSLREGDSVALDVMTGPVNGTCQVHTVTLEARLVLKASDPALARARYNADLWLVHTDPGGQEQREHLITNVDGSASTPFMFSRLSFPVPMLDPQQGNTEAFIQLTGSLRARSRTDGLIDLDVDTNRMIFGAERLDRPSSSLIPPARKTLTLKAEETTAIEFPPPASGYVRLALGDERFSGSSGIAARSAGSPQPATGAVAEVKSGTYILYTDRFFKGHRTQLLVTLRRVR
jgi:hypothetical protein